MSSATGVKGLLQAVAAGQRFSPEAMADAIDVLTADATPAQMAAFLMGLRVRGETVAEITGAARAMREKMTSVTVAPEAIDIVGTGGDGTGTFNVSTASCLVAAGAGIKVAKHGNRSVSSISGASDVLGALGVKLDVGPDVVAKAIATAGVAWPSVMISSAVRLSSVLSAAPVETFWTRRLSSATGMMGVPVSLQARP